MRERYSYSYTRSSYETTYEYNQVHYIKILWEYPSLCRVCCSFQLYEGFTGAKEGGVLAGEWLCLLPMPGSLHGQRNSCWQFVYAHSLTKTKAEKLLALFVNLASRVLHAVYSAHASATLCLSPPAGSLCRDTQGTLGETPLVAGGG